MKMISKYKSMGIISEEAAFQYLLANLKDTIRTYDFFVAWGKVLGNVSKIEVALNILNSLIGKDAIAEKLKELVRNYPEVVPVIPLLIAMRETNIKVADVGGDIEYSFVSRKTYNDEEIDNIILFADECGLLKILSDKSIKNLVDYSIGVEVGLDTHSRKNRSGDAMENLVEVYIKAICGKHGFRYLKHATAANIKSKFDKEVATDKSDRHFDFAIDANTKLYLIEVNYYGGGGSKLKSVAGEFKSLFELEMNTVWSFPDRGNWATHDAKYRGNWSPYIPRNLLLRYSQEGDLVLDQFVGGGTTLVEAKLLGRNVIGVDVNAEALKRCREKTNFENENSGKVYIREGDARNLDFVPDEGVDFICTHPPYSNIIQYSEDVEKDLSHLDVKPFLEQMKLVATECYRVLKKDKFCAILMGDTRKKGHVVPMSFDVMKTFVTAGFKIKEIIIKEQHNCKATGYWKTNNVKYNFLLLAHEYLFIFRK